MRPWDSDAVPNKFLFACSTYTNIWMNKLSFAMISFGLYIFKMYFVRIRLVEIQSEYCICSVLICELEICKTIILKRNGFSHGSGTDTFLRFLPNHSIDHHKPFTINMSFKSWLGHSRRLDVPRWGLSSWSLFGHFHWSLLHQCSELCLSALILKVQRTFKS